MIRWDAPSRGTSQAAAKAGRGADGQDPDPDAGIDPPRRLDDLAERAAHRAEIGAHCPPGSAPAPDPAAEAAARRAAAAQQRDLWLIAPGVTPSSLAASFMLPRRATASNARKAFRGGIRPCGKYRISNV